MIIIKHNYIDGNITKIEIEGHANYDVFGKDIICAAASTLLITCVNCIEELNANGFIYNDNKDKVSISIEGTNIEAFKILKVMIEMFKDLEQDYPKNISVSTYSFDNF